MDRPTPILIVEDDRDTRDSLREIIEAEGYPVLVAGNGNEALNILVEGDTELPGLIVLDLVMPQLSGWEFLMILRSYVRLAGIPVIVVSCRKPHPQTIERGLISGWMQKPIELTELVELVRAAHGIDISDALITVRPDSN